MFRVALAQAMRRRARGLAVVLAIVMASVSFALLTSAVATSRLDVQGTVEEKILALQRRKLALVSELIATDEAVIKHLTREDIEELLG